MKNKYTYVTFKVIFSLLLLMPIVSLVMLAFGADIAPKPEYYTNTQSYEFIRALMDAQYINIINAVVFALSLVLLWTKRTALAAVLIFPITLNIFAFHAFLDGGIFTSGALMGNIMFLINIYFFWYHFSQYSQILSKGDR